MSIVKINALTVPADQREVLEKRFGARAGTVESSDGFEWFELLRPLEGTDQYLVYTRWRSEEDFQAWMEGSGRRAHGGDAKPDAGKPGEDAADAGTGGGTEGATAQRPAPAATDSTLWTFEVVQQEGPKPG